MTGDDGNAEEGLDFVPTIGTLSFSGFPDFIQDGTELEFETITIPIIDDMQIDGDETFSVLLTNPQNVKILPDNESTVVTIVDATEPVFGISREGHATFGTDGVAEIDVDPTNTTPSTRKFETIQLPSGKFLQVGRLDVSAGQVLVRYNADGTPDSTFGTDGVVVDPTIGSGTDRAFAATAVADDKILVFGVTFHNATSFVTITRYNDDGSVDTTFGNSGRQLMEQGLITNNLFHFAVAPDGKYLLYGRGHVRTFGAVGSIGSADEVALSVVRLNADGTVDTSFGLGGQVTLDIIEGFDDDADAIAVQPDGKIVLSTELTMIRLNADGTLDTTFGPSGARQIPLPEPPAGSTVDTLAGSVTDIHVENDGSVLALAGVTYRVTLNSQRIDVLVGSELVKFSAAGSIDTSYGDDGILAMPGVHGRTFAFQTDGRILINNGIGIWRLNPDGVPDIGFGLAGLASFSQLGINFTSRDHNIFVQGDGKIVLGGDRDLDRGGFALARLRGGDAVGGFRLRMSKLVDEPAGSLLAQVERVGGTDGAATVEINTSDIGGATGGDDYSVVSQVLSFADGETIQGVTIDITNDLFEEGDELFNAALSGPTGGASLFPMSSIDVRIIDDDQPGKLQLEALSVSVDETAGTATVVIERIDGDLREVTVDLLISNGTATDGEDFTAKTETVTFADGETRKSVDVTILDDTDFEGNETIHLQLQSPTGGAVLGFKPTGRVTIIDDEPPPPDPEPDPDDLQFVASVFPTFEGTDERLLISVVRRGDLQGAASVDYGVTNGTAIRSVDYAGNSGTLIFLRDQAVASFFIDVLDDTQAEGDETINLSLSNPRGHALGELSSASVLIVDNEQAEFDFGDAPDPVDAMAGRYPTLLANGGARHTIINGFSMGSIVYAEGD